MKHLIQLHKGNDDDNDEIIIVLVHDHPLAL